MAACWWPIEAFVLEPNLLPSNHFTTKDLPFPKELRVINQTTSVEHPCDHGHQVFSVSNPAKSALISFAFCRTSQWKLWPGSFWFSLPHQSQFFVMWLFPSERPSMEASFPCCWALYATTIDKPEFRMRHQGKTSLPNSQWGERRLWGNLVRDSLRDCDDPGWQFGSIPLPHSG